MKIGFIGPGTMGRGMALNLAKGPDELTVFARRKEALLPFEEKGIKTSMELHALDGSEIVFLCLPDGRAVREVLLGGDAPALSPGSIIADCSTIRFEEAAEFGRIFAERGIAYLDAPVSGHREKAQAGTLTIMCGGDKAAFERVKPLFDRMGSTVLRMGETGAGQLTKMINNCVFNTCIASFCEMMPLGVKLGLDPEKLGEVLMCASGSSYASKTLIPEILEGNFEHGFTLEGAYKDMKQMAELLSREEIPLPAFAGTLQTYQLALQNGYGKAYKGAMIRFYEDLMGVECRK